MNELDRARAAVVTEAESWIGTPFHHAARIKGTAMNTDATAGLYRLLAWGSPAFPTGAFSYSHGLEAAPCAADGDA